jgi:steroid delta-isomerase-like uncharacterized protein
MTDVRQQNKAVVVRFNKEFIEQGKMGVFRDLVADDLVNHSAMPGMPNGPESMIAFLHGVLRKGFPDLKVEILDQVAENDKVSTRKEFKATHLGEFMGIPATGKQVTIKVTDIIKLRNGKYIEHWGLSNLAEVLQQLGEK